jgi:hypothetical protein
LNSSAAIPVRRPLDDFETDLLGPALVAIENEGLHIVFPFEPHDAGQRLLAFLGVTWTVDPDAPRLADPVSERDPETREIARLGRLRKGVST